MEELNTNFFISSVDSSEFLAEKEFSRSNNRIKKQDWIEEIGEKSNSIDGEDELKSTATSGSSIKNNADFSFHYKFEDSYLRGAKNNVKRLVNYEDLELDDEELDGILTDRVIAACSSNLDMTEFPGTYALSNCDLSRKSLKIIDNMKYYQFLRFLDLSRNYLTSLEALGSLPFLTYLDASHNLLDKLLDFKAPVHLTQVIYSYNLVEKIDDLSEFWTLVHLDVSHNLITKIKGLEKLRYLNYLNLSYNQVKNVKNLGNLRIETLLLNNNEIQKIGMSLEELFNLRNLELSFNKLASLKAFESVRKLECLMIVGNNVEDLIELEYLGNIRYLYNIDFRDNPVCCNEKYRMVCLKVMKNLLFFDGEEVDTEEAGLVRFTFDSKESRVGFNNVSLQILENFNVPEINLTVVPGYEKLVSIIILAGPCASKKNKFVSKICEKYPRFAVRGVSYTTRPQCTDEVSGEQYYFVSDKKFKELIAQGQLMSCSQKYGYYFGIGLAEIAKISENYGILVFDCDLLSALQVKTRFPNTSIIFTISKSESLHMKWLRQKFTFSAWISLYLRAFILKYLILRRTDEDSDEDEMYFESLIDACKKDDDVKSKTSNEEELDENEDNSTLVTILKATTVSSTTPQRQTVSFSVAVSSVLVPKEEIDESEEFEIPGTSKISTIFPSISEHLLEMNNAGFVLSTLSSSLLHELSSDESITSNRMKGESLASLKSHGESNNLPRLSSNLDEYVKFENKASLSFSMNEEKEIDTLTNIIVSESSGPYILTTISNTDQTHEEAPRGGNDKDKSVSSNGLQIHCASENFKELEDVLSKSSLDFQLCKTTESDIDLESEAKRIYTEYFLNLEMIKRRKYWDTFFQYPGLYITSIHPDDELESFKKIELVIKNCVQAQKRYYAEKEFSNDLIDSEMRQAKIDMLLNLLK